MPSPIELETQQKRREPKNTSVLLAVFINRFSITFLYTFFRGKGYFIVFCAHFCCFYVKTYVNALLPLHDSAFVKGRLLCRASAAVRFGVWPTFCCV